MGAAAASMMAGSHYPSLDAITSLCCLDMLGPLARATTPETILQGLRGREKYLQRQLRGPKASFLQLHGFFSKDFEGFGWIWMDLAARSTAPWMSAPWQLSEKASFGSLCRY